MSFIIIIFYISFIGFLYYIEKNITNPIESISSSVNEYTNSKNKIEDSNNIVKKLNSLQNKQIEIEILAESFEQMIKDLKLYYFGFKKYYCRKRKN
ncbi:hypothetical protein [Methanobrevibacter arboriphilus]|uniref:hypothetical protein n=1 Tax=Methanobrevibacter arboriphilus TaxID=39441 RepID=UPI0012E0C80E|nr:hypothetical protein [Methanobrevibacter arboriphilus]